MGKRGLESRGMGKAKNQNGWIIGRTREKGRQAVRGQSCTQTETPGNHGQGAPVQAAEPLHQSSLGLCLPPSMGLLSTHDHHRQKTFVHHCCKNMLVGNDSQTLVTAGMGPADIWKSLCYFVKEYISVFCEHLARSGHTFPFCMWPLPFFTSTVLSRCGPQAWTRTHSLTYPVALELP
jgi:hypothetical protein